MARNSARKAAMRGVLGEPRGRLLTELCGHPKTAVELARQVGTSSNAVRVHLEGLRTAGLVAYRVERRGVGKPTHVYSLTSDAEYLLSSAYGPALQALLDTLHLRLNHDFAPMVRGAGESLARRYKKAAQPSSHPGVDGAAEILETLGAPTTVQRRGKESVLSTGCCPLAAVTRTTAEVCQLMEQALTSVSGIPMRERCHRGEHPRCSFVFSARSTA